MKATDIPTHEFNSIICRLLRYGWRKMYEYENFDAWIDYGKVVLERDGTRLVFEWDNWFEGQVEGPEDTLTALGLRKHLAEPC